jgi:transposase
VRHAPGRAHRTPSPDRDGLGACLQCPGSRRARVPPHRRPPSLFCPQREAELGEAVCAAQRTAATPPIVGADPAPRWTLRRLVGWVRERFGLRCCRETIRKALHRRKLSWKKAKKLLGRADPERRQAFIEQLQGVLEGAQRDRHLVVYVDEAHLHQDADLGYGWAKRGERFWVASSSPGLSARVSFYGLYLYNEGQVRLWPFPRANGEHTIEVLQRLRAAFPDEALIVLWDGAPYHRAKAVREAATTLNITLMPLPGYSPDLMPVEELWRWLREDVTYHHCHASAQDLTRRVADFEVRLNQDPFVIADRLWVKDHLDPDEEKLRFSK